MVNPDKVANLCASILRKYSDTTEIEIIPYLDNKEFYSSVAKKGAIENQFPIESGTLIKTVKFYKCFWINVSINFKEKVITAKNFTYDLESVNIKIFNFENDISELIIRAEWTNTLSSIHAQPHWQVHPRTEIVAQNIDDFNSLLKLEQSRDLFDTTKSSKFKIQKFHFAMASKWQDGKTDSHLNNLNDKTVKNWLDGCLCYIKQQLDYCN
ncbi:MAG: hypothetical protein IT280_10450 [Ignavibacteria bacterium]|nr:hypothetical protein [Ignavibacteria bacterium]